MKTQDEIEDHIRLLLSQELTRLVSVATEKLPHNCRHNHQQPLDTRRLVDGAPNESWNRITARRGLPVMQTMGLCMMGAEHAETWPGTICDEPLDAQRCPYFHAQMTAVEVDEEFRAQTQEAEWVREHLPAVHALLWTLESSTLPEPVSVAPLALIPPKPWWERLWAYFRRP